MANELPLSMVSKAAAQRLRRQYPWVYRQDVLEPPVTAEPGAIVRVVDVQRNWIGQAFYSRGSPLALRLLTYKKPEEESVDEAFFARRLARALNRRKPYAGREAYRLVHGEADLLPGFFADRYGHGLVMQSLSEGAEVRKEMLGSLLAELCGSTRVVCRDDGSGRDFEGLKREVRVLRGAAPFKVSYREGENQFEVDLLEDMKTGSFLDQLDNHLRSGELGFGEALDCFSYHGGFALALARGCSSVLAIEQEASAAARAAQNAKSNNLSHVTVQEANAFDVLHAFAREGRKFDTIVLDPPGLAKRKQGIPTALNAYRELNLRAFKCLRPDGLLATCSCSGKVNWEMFEKTVLSAAHDAKRWVQIIERRGAGLDHPILASLPESEYLKALFLRVV
jgi:23S rRNA (cytosine1962-C5)-methyltransferase